jgi:hypothetical protein
MPEQLQGKMDPDPAPSTSRTLLAILASAGVLFAICAFWVAIGIKGGVIPHLITWGCVIATWKAIKA